MPIPIECALSPPSLRNGSDPNVERKGSRAFSASAELFSASTFLPVSAEHSLTNRSTHKGMKCSSFPLISVVDSVLYFRHRRDTEPRRVKCSLLSPSILSPISFVVVPPIAQPSGYLEFCDIRNYLRGPIHRDLTAPHTVAKLNPCEDPPLIRVVGLVISTHRAFKRDPMPVFRGAILAAHNTLQCCRAIGSVTTYYSSRDIHARLHMNCTLCSHELLYINSCTRAIAAAILSVYPVNLNKFLFC